MPIKALYEITNPFPNFNGGTVEVWEWISNFILHFIIDVTTFIHIERVKIDHGANVLITKPASSKSEGICGSLGWDRHVWLSNGSQFDLPRKYVPNV